jgi:UDP-GlcNAc:undecaprenyl-phosphate GlcNAc-1-phosphate transferase
MSQVIWSWSILAFILPLSILVTRLMISLAPKLGLMDIPEDRRIHNTPIPRSGGLGLFFTMTIGLVLMYYKGLGFSDLLNGPWLAHFLAGSVLLVVAGYFDDRGGISAWKKLGVQITAAVAMFLHNPGGVGRFMGWEIPWEIDLAIHVGWTVALINAFNLIDGMDGLCAGLGTIALLILTALAVTKGRAENAFVIALMALALIGFLRYNFHPARIFLGDTGSMLVGFFIASVGTVTAGRQAVVPALLLPLLVGGVPLLDVALAVWRRYARRLSAGSTGPDAIRIFGPDRDHLHHRLLRWGFSQPQAALLIYALAGITSMLALLPILGGSNLFSVSVVGLILIGLVGLRYIAPVEFMASGRGMRTLVRRPKACRQVMLRYLTYDVVVLFASATLAWWLLAKAMIRPLEWSEALNAVTLFVACIVVSLGFARAHSRRWSRASARDFAGCVLWMACGTAISFALSGASHTDISFRNVVFHISAFTLGSVAVIGPRCAGFLLQEGVIDTMHRKRRLSSKRSNKTTLIYGAGDLGELFLCHLRLSRPEVWGDYHFIGFLDDNENLKGRRMLGFPILGSLANLREVVRKSGANCVLITSSVLPEERINELIQTAEILDLEIEKWLPDMSVSGVRTVHRRVARPEEHSAPAAAGQPSFPDGVVDARPV